MTKNVLLNEVRERLKGYPRDEVDNSIEYYSEMIDDRIEDGMSEAEAVASIGDINDIVKSIKVNMPLKSVIKGRVHENKEKKGDASVSVATILLLILFFPFWFPIAITLFVLYLVFFILTWVFDGVMFIVGAVSVLSFIVSLITGITCFAALDPMAGVASLGLAIAGVGAGILLIIAGIYLAKGIVLMFAGILKSIKRLIIGKGE